jgi:very-short-patch-repair endonuclease
MVNRPGLQVIEAYFNMPFKDVINELHWKNGQSIKCLSDQCGISRDTFQRNAKRLKLKLRSHQKAIELDVPNRSGDKHWAYGLTKENSEWAKMHSDRMKINNPCRNPEILRKKQESTAEKYRNNMLPQEMSFADILNNHNVFHLPQYVIGSYIIDFYIPRLNLCIEIDSTYKWGNDRKIAAQKKDDYLIKERSFNVLRINKDFKIDRILNILKANNIIRE